LGTQIFQQSQELYFSLTESGGRGALTKLLENSIEHLQKLFPPLGEFSINVDQYLKQGLSWLLQNLGGFFSNFAKLLTSAFIFLISLYYLLKDSSKLRKAVTALSPLADTDDEIILKKLKLAVDSVVRGNITIALIQGALTALGFTLFGVPNAILWGTVTAIAAIIPGIGTALVLIPAIVFLFLSGNTFSAFGLLLWGILAVGLIDNFLGPKLVGRGMQLHPLIVFLSVLGGLIFFGPLGFLLGPLTLSLCFVVLDIYLPRRGHES